MTDRPSLVRRGLGMLAGTGFSILFCLLLFEVGSRITGSYTPRPPLYPGDREVVREANHDPVLGWKLAPSREITETKEEYSVTYHSNPQGFRSPYDFGQPFDGRRIAFVGDSFTFGSGVEYEETFVARVEAKLPGWQALNYGIGGFGIDQMWLTVRDRVLPNGADLVVLVFIRNDLERSLTSIRMGNGWLEKPTFRLEGEELTPVNAADKPRGLAGWWQRNTRLAELWRRTERSLSRTQSWAGPWRLNRALIEAAAEDCRRVGVPFAVVHLPVNRRSPMPVLEPEMARSGIPAFDMAPGFPSDPALYYPLDHHFTAKGHQVAAERLHQFLLREGLLEAGDAIP